MFCNKCGREIGDGAILCDDCNIQTVPEDRMAIRARERGRQVPTLEWNTDGFPPTDILKTDDVWEFIEKTTKSKPEENSHVTPIQSEDVSVSYSDSPTIDEIMSRPELFGMKEDLEALEKELLSDMDITKSPVETPLTYTQSIENEMAQKILDEQHAKLSGNLPGTWENEDTTLDSSASFQFDDSSAARYDNFIFDNEESNYSDIETFNTYETKIVSDKSIDTYESGTVISNDVESKAEETGNPYMFVPPVFLTTEEGLSEIAEQPQDDEPYAFESPSRWLENDTEENVSDVEAVDDISEGDIFDLLSETEMLEDAITVGTIGDETENEEVVDNEIENDAIEEGEISIDDILNEETPSEGLLDAETSIEEVLSTETLTEETPNVEELNAEFLNADSESEESSIELLPEDAEQDDTDSLLSDYIDQESDISESYTTETSEEETTQTETEFEPKSVESLTMEDLFGTDVFQELEKEDAMQGENPLQDDTNADSISTDVTEPLVMVEDEFAESIESSEYSEETIDDELLGATIRVLPKNPEAEKSQADLQVDAVSTFEKESTGGFDATSSESDAMDEVESEEFTSQSSGRMSLNEVFDEEDGDKKSKKEKKNKKEKTGKSSTGKKIGLIILKVIAVILILYILLQVTMIVAVEFFPDTAFSDWAIDLESTIFDLLLGS